MDKEALKEEKKKVADLNEACTLAEERTENAISDREKFHEKNKEFIHKFQQMKDNLQDKDLKIEELEAKMNLL